MSEVKTKMGAVGRPNRGKDSRWKWMVVVGSGFVHMLTVGEASGSALFLVEFIEEFEASVTATSWVFGIVPLCGILGM